MSQEVEQQILSSRSADGSEPGGTAAAFEGSIVIQNEPDKLQEHSEKNRMQFKMNQCKVVTDA